MSESAFDRILGEIRETRGVVDAHLRPAVESLVQAEIEQLVGSAREWQARLRLSSAEIDHNLSQCRRHWADIEHACNELAAINDRLLSFGREPVFNKAELFPANNLVATIIDRIGHK